MCVYVYGQEARKIYMYVDVGESNVVGDRL